jgi:two-component system KDP operon response regulator KdpE
VTSDETVGRDGPSRREDDDAEAESALTGATLSPSLSPMRAAALVVDDEPHIRRALRNALAGEFERVLEASTAVEAVDLAAAHRPDMIILDLGLPDRPGQWVCAELRKWSTAPIIVLSAHHAEAEKIRMLDEGADDYVTKPFSPAELLARVRAQLRRARIEEAVGTGGALTVGSLVIDTGARTVRRGGEDIHLTPTEWELLRAFVRYAGKTLTHRQLFQAVWAASSGDPQQYLRVYVANLRRKLEPDAVRPTLIITEPGVGYRFETGS